MTILVYSKRICPYCDHAKKLLDSLGVQYQEINVDENQEQLEKMMRDSGRRTVPQIFIHGKSIGGFDDLSALHQAGKLVDMIKKGDD